MSEDEFLQDRAWEATMGYPRGFGYPIDARTVVPQKYDHPSEYSEYIRYYDGLGLGYNHYAKPDSDGYLVGDNNIYEGKTPLNFEFGRPADEYYWHMGDGNQQRAADYRAEYENRLEQERAMQDYLNYRGAY